MDEMLYPEAWCVSGFASRLTAPLSAPQVCLEVQDAHRGLTVARCLPPD